MMIQKDSVRERLHTREQGIVRVRLGPRATQRLSGVRIVRRKLALAVVLLLAGAITNVAVVFGFPRWGSNAFPCAEEDLAIAHWPRPVPAEWSKLQRADRLSVPGISCIFAEGHDSGPLFTRPPT